MLNTNNFTFKRIFVSNYKLLTTHLFCANKFIFIIQLGFDVFEQVKSLFNKTLKLL